MNEWSLTCSVDWTCCEDDYNLTDHHERLGLLFIYKYQEELKNGYNLN